MDSEMKDLLEKTLEVAEDNNRILRGIRRMNRVAMVWRIVYIAIFLGGAAFAYNYLQPYLEGIRGTYESVVKTQTQVNNGVNGFKAFFGGTKEEQK